MHVEEEQYNDSCPPVQKKLGVEEGTCISINIWPLIKPRKSYFFE